MSNSIRDNKLADIISRSKFLIEYSYNNALDKNNTYILEQTKTSNTYTWTGPSNLSTTSRQQFTGGNIPFGEVMEKFREGLYSIPGMTIEYALTEIGVTAPIVITAWASLLAWDLYRWVYKGEFDGLNLLFDLLGTVGSGVLTGVLSPIYSELKNISKGLVQTPGKYFYYLINYLKEFKPEIWTKLKPWLLILSKSLTLIKDGLKEAGTWVAKTFKSSYINKVLTNLNIKVSELVETISTALGAEAQTAKKIAKTTTKATKFGLGVLGFEKALKAFEKYNQERANQDFSNTSIDDIQSKLIIDNPQIYGKPINIIGKRDDGANIKFMRDINGNFYYDTYGTFVQADNDREKEIIEGEFFKQDIYDDLKFDNFKIIDKDKGIYIINNQKYKGFKNKENKWILQKYK